MLFQDSTFLGTDHSRGELVLEDIDLYSYGFYEEAPTYMLFRFSMGVDNWIICLDDPYPTPIIKEAFPNNELKLIWYSPEELKSSNSKNV